ncbi:MAG: 16S rRNA (uracil(1498)-N(3))-methyltransferase [Nitrospinae bacterium]|nr:16S rRNA (uracil(1498)-N(3))-methyltransferase [Nitrospinota bacterium]
MSGNPVEGGTAEIGGSDARHMTSVLRLGVGNKIRVFTEGSKAFFAEITETSRNRVVIRMLGETTAPGLKPPKIHLAVGAGKPQAMEVAVQKAVELGCLKFFPLITERSELLTTSRTQRLRRIAVEACKQCGRAEPIELSDPVTLADLPKEGLKIALWEDEEETTLKTALEGLETPLIITLVVGPVGGFAADEISEMRAAGFVTARFGPLILRTETAAISLVAVINYHFNRM